LKAVNRPNNNDDESSAMLTNAVASQLVLLRAIAIAD
jgi:hypothetical protein